MSTSNFNQNKIRPYLPDLLIWYAYFLSHTKKTFQTTSLSYNNLTDASAAWVKFQIINITEFFAVPYTNHFFATKIIQIHGFHLVFFINICIFFQNEATLINFSFRSFAHVICILLPKKQKNTEKSLHFSVFLYVLYYLLGCAFAYTSRIRLWFIFA